MAERYNNGTAQFLLAILVILLLAGPLAAETVRVKKVVDGDTLILADGRKVRLLGINTPEKGEPYFHKARRFTEAATKDTTLQLEYDREGEDGYGRLLAYVYVKGEMLNARLVKEGLAHVMLIGANQRHASLLLHNQAEARKKRKGLWSIWRAAKTLKLTSLHLDENGADSYVRIVCLAPKETLLAGYALVNEEGDKFVFPKITLSPGQTVIVTSSESSRHRDNRSQAVLYWPKRFRFQEKGDTAFLLDPAGNIIDQLVKR